MSTNHAYSWIVTLKDDSTHQVDADELHLKEGFAVWAFGQTGAKYIVCAIPSTEIRSIDIMSQMTGLRSQRTALDALEWEKKRKPT